MYVKHRLNFKPASIDKSAYCLLVCDTRNRHLQLCEWLLCSLGCQLKITLDSGKCSASATHI